MGGVLWEELPLNQQRVVGRTQAGITTPVVLEEWR